MSEGEQIGTVTAVNLYPIKSCTGISLNEGYCFYHGLRTTDDSARDRHFMIITPDGKMVTQRNQPRMALIKTSFHGDQLYVDAPEMSTLKLPLKPAKISEDSIRDCRVWGDDIQGLDCGDEAARWLSDFLKSQVRLVFSASDMKKRIPKETHKDHPAAQLLKYEDQVVYHDGLPILLIGTASLDDVNSRLSKKVTMKTFRPNIQVETKVPYEEDGWKTLRIGSTTLNNVGPCDRCLLTTVDPETGVKSKDQEPFKTLKTYRIIPEVDKHAPCFGTRLTILEPGTLRVGDPVFLL